MKPHADIRYLTNSTSSVKITRCGCAQPPVFEIWTGAELDDPSTRPIVAAHRWNETIRDHLKTHGEWDPQYDVELFDADGKRTLIRR